MNAFQIQGHDLDRKLFGSVLGSPGPGGFPDSYNSKFPDVQTPAAAMMTTDKLSDPNLTTPLQVELTSSFFFESCHS